jgi:hypothetical protein
MNKLLGRTAFHVSELVQAVPFTATQAEIIAGKTITAGRKPRQTLKPIGYRLDVTGSINTLTDIRISSDNDTPVDIVTVTQGNLSGRISPDGGTKTEGAGLDANLGAGDGIQLRSTGSDMTGGGSIAGVIYFLNTSG